VYITVGLFLYYSSGVLGLKYQLALNALLGIEESAFSKMRKRLAKRKQVLESGRGVPSNGNNHNNKSGFWRPQLLVYLHIREGETPEDDVLRTQQLLSFTSQLKASSSGLTIVGSVIKECCLTSFGHHHSDKISPRQQGVESAGTRMASQMAEDFDKLKQMKQQIMAEMEKYGVVGFAEVVTAPDYRSGFSMLMQLSGLGALRPNTCVLRWPDFRTINHEVASRLLVRSV